MPRAIVRTLLLRELRAVRRTLAAYPDDAAVWAQPTGAPNSAGTLALHVAGNLRHFIGARLGGTDYVRDRGAEFAARDLPRDAIVAELDAAIAAVDETLTSLPDDQLRDDYPEPMGGRTVSIGDMLVHLAVHLAYHLGQLDYHRRIVTGDVRGIDAMSVRELGPGEHDV